MVKYSQILGGVALSGIAAMVQPAWAATTVSDVQVRTTSNGVEVELVSDASERPQIFLLPPQGNDLVAHVSDARLGIPGGELRRADPAPGIVSVEVVQLDSSTIQVTVKGDGSRPVGRIRQSGNPGNLVLAYTGTGTVARQGDSGDRAGSRPPAAIPAQTSPLADVLVPNPGVTIDGQQAALQPVVPPTLPRAVAIPQGDIAVSDVPIRPYTVSLGTNQVIPRLVLRDAPVREVLSLLARAGGVNIAFTEMGGDSCSNTQGGGDANPRISVDIENESVQDVFNYVLRISGLQANRVGQTVFVGKTLPNSARNVIVRSIRVNQTSAESAAGFLVTLGAESASTATERRTEVVQVDVGTTQGGGTGGQGQVQSAPLTQTTTVERTTINELRYEPQDSIPILRGLQVAVDQRTNSLTLVGQRDLVSLASEQLARIDGRVRQVAVNVRVIDINLDETERIGTSFSFGIDGTRIVNTGGIGIINWNDRGAPFSVAPTTVGTLGTAPLSINQEAFGENSNPFNFSSDFLAQLQLAVVNNNAKILTDPTLVVQEGQVAQVELTEEVVGTIESETTTTNNNTTVSTTVEKERSGLILGIQVDRIDDNGFISLSVSPSLRVPIGQVDERQTNALGANGVFVTLLSERRLSSGRIRIRDGQTLVLAGIIQDTDRSTVTKIPILGDLPLLGALFRRTERDNDRRELVVLVTPQLIDDSNASTVGYSYTPSRDAQEFIRRSVER